MLLVWVASGVATLALAFALARSTKRRFTDVHSAHLLVMSAIIMMLLCYLWQSFVIAAWLTASLQAGRFELVSGLFVFAFLLPFGDMLFAVLAGPRHFRRHYQLSSQVPRADRELVDKLAGQLGLSDVSVRAGRKLASPFVYGRIGSRPVVALPTSWRLPRAQRELAILHELAHILNGDTIFVTTAGMLIRRARSLFLLGVLTVVGTVLRIQVAGVLLHMTIVYLYCWIILAVLLSVISRQRELLADQTVAQFLGARTEDEESGSIQLDRLFASEDGEAKRGDYSRWSSARRWLDERALLARPRFIWRAVRAALFYVFARHPSVQDRRDHVLAAQQARLGGGLVLPTRETAFWIGCTVGTCVVLAFMMCSIWDQLAINAAHPESAGKRFGTAVLLLTWPLIGLTGCLYALPACSELAQRYLSFKGVGILLHRQLYFLLGAMLGFVILLRVWLRPAEMLVSASAVLIVVLLIAGVSVPFACMITDVYHHGRRHHRYVLRDTMLGVRSIGVGIVIAVGIFIVGFADIILANKARGVGCLVGFVAALVYTIWGQEGNASAADRYLVCPVPFSRRAFRGDLSPRNMLICNLAYWAEPYAVGLVAGAGAYALGRFAVNSLGTVTILIAIDGMVFLCFLLLAWRHRGRITTAKRAGICEICCCLDFFGEAPSAELAEELKTIYTEWHRALFATELRKGRLPIALDDVFEMVAIRDWGGAKWIGSDRITEWVRACENQSGGFGPWPKGKSRLSMTYYALSILKRVAALEQADVDRHAKWITGMCTDSGMFGDQLSGRTALEDSFFAVEALRLLGASPERNISQRMTETVLLELMRAVRLRDVEAVWHCAAILQTLGSPAKASVLRHFLKEYAFILPSRNVLYRSRHLHALLEACGIVFEGRDGIAGLFPPDFPDQLSSALEAEIRPIAKRLRQGQAA